MTQIITLNKFYVIWLYGDTEQIEAIRNKIKLEMKSAYIPLLDLNEAEMMRAYDLTDNGTITATIADIVCKKLLVDVLITSNKAPDETLLGDICDEISFYEVNKNDEWQELASKILEHYFIKNKVLIRK